VIRARHPTPVVRFQATKHCDKEQQTEAMAVGHVAIGVTCPIIQSQACKLWRSLFNLEKI
jgi:hypothetical protein